MFGRNTKHCSSNISQNVFEVFASFAEGILLVKYCFVTWPNGQTFLVNKISMFDQQCLIVWLPPITVLGNCGREVTIAQQHWDFSLGQTINILVKHLRFEMFDRQCLIFWPRPYRTARRKRGRGLLILPW